MCLYRPASYGTPPLQVLLLPGLGACCQGHGQPWFHMAATNTYHGRRPVIRQPVRHGWTQRESEHMTQKTLPTLYSKTTLHTCTLCPTNGFAAACGSSIRSNYYLSIKTLPTLYSKTTLHTCTLCPTNGFAAACGSSIRSNYYLSIKTLPTLYSKTTLHTLWPTNGFAAACGTSISSNYYLRTKTLTTLHPLWRG